MKTARWLALVALPLSVLLAGCSGSKQEEKGPASYPIKGKVVALSPDPTKPSVKLDHEAIPRLGMKAMVMDYAVEDPKLLEGLKVGDRVEGSLKVEGDKYTLTDLEKEEADPEVKAALAKLSPEDRRLARAQGFCAVQKDNRLGSMGVPVKVMVKGQPVFLCCKACDKKALADPDKTLATVQELREKVARPGQ